MISNIFSFELRYRFRHPLTYLILFMLAGQGIWYALGVYDYYTSDETLLNGAGIFYQCMAGGGMLVVAIVAMISGSTLYRDIAVGSAYYVYACPLDEKRFFLTHFITAYTINLLLVAAYPLGMVLIKYSGLGEPHQLGSTPWPELIHGYLIFCVPNLFVLTAVCFFCLVHVRKISAAYIGVVALTVLFVVSEVMSENSPYRFFLEVMDPFGYVYCKLLVHELPVALKNSGFLPMTASFWVNRLVWIFMGLLGLYLSYRRFSFQYFLRAPAGAIRQKAGRQESDCASSFGDGVPIPKVLCQYGRKENLLKVLRLAKVEFLSVVRPASFKIIFGLLIFIIFMQNLFWNSTYYIGHQVPLTSGMCNVRLANGFLFMVILMLLAGELFYKERTSGFWQITGAAPSPTWVLQVPKLLAMFAVAFVFALAIFGGGICAQALQGFWDMDLALYMGDIFGYKFGWITYMFNIVLVFFLAGLFNNRYLTHVVAIGYYLFIIISFDIGLIEQVRFGYSLTPGLDDYSEMMGYGIWERSSFFFFLMWTALAVVFVLAGIQFWRRGTEQRAFSLRRLLGGELTAGAKVAGLAALVVFFVLQGVIVRQSNELRNYISSDQADAESALYETVYAKTAGSSRLARQVNDLQIDLFPEQRRAEYAATMTLANLSIKPLGTLYLNVDAHTQISSLTLGNAPLDLAKRDVALGMSAYNLPDPIQPGEKATIFIKAVRQYRGFPQTADEPQADLAYNGLFFTEALPLTGFDSDKTLQDNRDRENYHLTKLVSRLDPIDDAHGLRRGFVSPWQQPDGTQTLNLTVSTSVPQQPFAPGRVIRTWQEGDRNYAFFQVDTPNMVQPYIGSAAYQSRKSLIERVQVNLLYHPGHDYNLNEFEHAIGAGIAFINTELGVYPYPELRVAEIPYHQKDSYAMAGAIALSEKEGWYGDRNVGEIRGYIQYVLARDLIRQWIAANSFIPDVQGADMIWTALPGALALQVVDSRVGAREVEALFVKMRKTYHKDRTNEPIREPPLIFADNIDYLEANKGTMALYKLAGAVGYDRFNRFVGEWITQSSGPLVFHEFYEKVKKSWGLDPALCRLFEVVEDQVAL
nr:hypothetical protein [uncultured Desulfobacter sp.]